MALEFIWQLPARGDARYADAANRLRGERRSGEVAFQPGVSDPRGVAFNYFDYLHQVARGAELSGFDGVRIQHDSAGDESWIIAGYVARATRSLKLIAEFEASWGSAVYAAKNAVSFQRYTQGRLAWQVSAGAGEAERSRYADPVPDADVLARIEEFLGVARGVITNAPFSFKGRFFEVSEGGFRGSLANHPTPEVYLAGESEDALDASARHADVHVLEARAPNELGPTIQALRALSSQHALLRRSTPLALGLRLDVLARETRDEARFDATRYAEQRGQAQSAEPKLLWPSLTSGARATLVGSYDDVIEALVGYSALGISRFLLSGVPHLEEAYRLGTYVLPVLRRRLANQAAA
ncbi:MAG: LLM class flavin-dependent oxidoreductase [Polyangiaceae bacterium]